MEPKRVCLITGAAQGIGKGVAEALAAEGWALAANDINSDGIATLAAELQGRGLSCLALPGDVASKADVDRMVAETLRTHGRIDALVNNAGILHPASILEITPADWERVIDINLNGAFFLAQAVARHMVEQGIRGRIINMSTINSKIPRWRESAYCVSKAAMTHLTRVLALELAQYGINVTSVSPGSIDAGVLWHHFQDRSWLDKVVKGDPETFRLGIPLGHLGTVDDVAAAVQYLLSPGAKHVTGIELFVDGGQSMF